MLIATLGTALGFAFDAGSGNRELSAVFATLYLLGCVAAVLAVRQEAIFTAVVQPPLILFVAVPGAYFLFHLSEIDGIKDILINCGYPLIERFLLMFTTSVIVLLIGMARWYFGDSARPAPAAATRTSSARAAAGPAALAGVLAAVKAKLSTLAMPRRAAPDGEDPRRHAIDRNTTSRPRPGSRRPTKRAAPSRSRHVRPPLDDGSAPPPSPRRRPTHARDREDDFDAPLPPRRRAPRDPSRRPPPPDYPREPRQPRQRSPYERPMPRPDRYGPPGEPYPGGDPYDMPPPRRRPAAANGSHHPVSKVRYRGADAGDSGAEENVQHRRRPRARHSRYSDYD